MNQRLNTRWIGEGQIDPVLRHANYFEAPASGGFGPRYIQEFQILCVHEGQALVTLDEHTFEIQPGDFVFYGPRQRHQVVGLTDFKLTGFVLLFRREDTQKLATNRQLALRKPSLRLTSMEINWKHKAGYYSY